MAYKPEDEGKGASANAIQYHYDVADDFYRLWLDPTMTYSCPMWTDEDDTDLHAAQQRKYDYHIEQSQAADCKRVIDIGCGWGGQLARLVEVGKIENAVGLTLSQTQRDSIVARNLPGVDVRLESWADHTAEPYDAAISIGAFEHFARYGVSHSEKIDSYRRFFIKARELLTPGARLSLQTMAYGTIARDKVHKDLFIAEEIFPESDFPRLADIAEASEMLFEVERVRNDRKHYARAYRMWFDNLCARESQALEIVSKEVFDRYKRYLRLFSYSFELGSFDLLRLTLRSTEVPQ